MVAVRVDRPWDRQSLGIDYVIMLNVGPANKVRGLCQTANPRNPARLPRE